MSIFSIIKKEFEFLTNVYNFKIYDKQKYGAYYYISWTNSKISIKVLYDCREEDPVSIFVYDADSLGTIYDVDEYTTEFIVKSGTSRERVHSAAVWLNNAISDKTIVV